MINVALGRDALESVLFSVALAVGLTPEFLPMITTVTLAQGAVRMAREKVIPFDFERRRLSVVVSHGDSFLLVTKGAPEGVLAACTTCEVDGEIRALDAGATEHSLAALRALSQRGLRVLAVAYRMVPRASGFRPPTSAT